MLSLIQPNILLIKLIPRPNIKKLEAFYTLSLSKNFVYLFYYSLHFSALFIFTTLHTLRSVCFVISSIDS